MTAKIKTSGLCISCSNAKACSFFTNQTKPIIFCEEFSNTEYTEKKKDILEKKGIID